MIRQSSVLLLLLSVLTAGTLSAQLKVPQKEKNSYLRFEINGVPDRIVSKTRTNPNASSGYAGWYGPDKYYVLTVNMKEPLSGTGPITPSPLRRTAPENLAPDAAAAGRRIPRNATGC